MKLMLRCSRNALSLPVRGAEAADAALRLPFATQPRSLSTNLGA